MKNGWYAFGLLLAACAGAVAKPAIIPPAAANPNAQKWEYFCAAGKNPETAMQVAKNAGGAGWEMAAATHAVWCFKRPL